MSKNYEAKVVALDCFGDAILELPKELIEELDWNVGDKLNYEVVGKSVVIKNLTKENENETRRNKNR
jgi:S-adenosylmethionine hydrolase